MTGVCARYVNRLCKFKPCKQFGVDCVPPLVMGRGAFDFKVTPAGDLLNHSVNVATLRRLWLDQYLVSGEDLGPGDRGDFDRGAWHVACHLAGQAG